MTDTPLEEEFVDFFSGLFSGFGLDQLGSRLTSIIFLEPGEVSMDQLAEKTGYSLASLSNKLRHLESLNMVRRVKKPGTKKSFYFIEKDVYAIMHRKLQAIQDRFITPAKNHIPAMIDKYSNAKLKADEKQKLEIIKGYFRQLLEVDECMQRTKKELEKKAR